MLSKSSWTINPQHPPAGLNRHPPSSQHSELPGEAHGSSRTRCSTKAGSSRVMMNSEPRYAALTSNSAARLRAIAASIPLLPRPPRPQVRINPQRHPCRSPPPA